MIYTEHREEEYRVKFYLDTQTNKSPVKEYIDRLTAKERAKILKYIEKGVTADFERGIFPKILKKVYYFFRKA